MPLVQTSNEGSIGYLHLTRPEARNALSIEMCDAIADAITILDADPLLRAIVVHGDGPTFCSGADFAAVGGPDAPAFLIAFERMLETVWTSRLPSIAAIQGAALGGGFQLATVCDFRLAEADAKIGIPSARLGVVVNFENIERLALLAGPTTAREMLVAGRIYTGKEAADKGLVSLAPGRAMEAAEALASDIAKLAPNSVQASKQALITIARSIGGTRAVDPKGAQAHDERVAAAYSSPDLAEGLAAMAEKRPPTWTGN